MKTSIGIFVHNEEKNIGKLLRSTMQQSLKNQAIAEVIVVSSASTDDTDRIVEELSREDGWFVSKEKGAILYRGDWKRDF